MSKIFVVSLPRTGTTSIVDLLNAVEIPAIHVPSTYLNKKINEFTRFSDTPCYDPAFIADICYREPKKHKFIYIERNIYSWLLSIEKCDLYFLYKEMVSNENLNEISFLDKRCWGNVFGFDGIYNKSKFSNRFREHRAGIELLLKNEQFFKYPLGSDTSKLLEFVGADPKYFGMPFPHANESKIFQ